MPTNFPTGVTSFGVPVLPSGLNAITGKAFFVSSVTGVSSADGRTPQTPVATIAQAQSLATASSGDVIFLLPGHTETCTGAGTITISKAGLSIVSLGVGRARATINYTTSTAASFDVTAANVLLQNIVFVGTGVDAVADMLKVSAADLTVRGCEFEHANATNQAANVLLTTAAADRLVVEDCRFFGTNNAGTNSAISLVGGASIVLQRNFISGAYHASNGVIKNATTDSVNLLIRENNIQNFTGTNTKAIVLTSSSTGHITGNHMQILSGTAPITGAAMSWAGRNYYAATIATAGTLI